MLNKKQAFTLVELVISIVIITIIFSFAFLRYTSYISSSRDALRVSNIKDMRESLEYYALNNGKYPLPDNGNQVSYNGELVWTQGFFGDNLVKKLSPMLKEKPLDPLTKEEYIYSVSYKKNEYEILSILESNLISNNIFLNNVNADKDFDYPKIDGNYNKIFVESLKNYIISPSLINAEVNGNNIELNNSNIKSQIITGGDNLPKTLNNDIFTGGININLNVYNNKITEKSSLIEKENFGNFIISSYSGTILSGVDFYKNILSISNSIDLISLVEKTALKGRNIKKEYLNCDSGSKLGVNFPTISYNYVSLNNNEDITGMGNEILIQNGVKNYSSNIYCYNGIVSVSNEIEVITCNNGYVLQGGLCVLDQCNGVIVENGVSNAITQSINNTWFYNLNPGICTFVCNTNYTWNGSICNADTRSELCGGSIPSNATATTSSNYTQTWNGTVWTPTTNWGENQATCDFNCNSNYTWNGSLCNADTRSELCGGSVPSNATATTSSNYTQTWNGTAWTPTTNWGENQATCDFNCNSNYTWNGSICSADTRSELCGGSIPSNATATTSSNYTQTWNGTAWTPTTNWGENQATCDFNCNTNYTWNGSICNFVDPVTTCSVAGEIKVAASTYPACDTPDIIVCSGVGVGYTIASCNVGSTIAGTTSSSYGNYYQFGKSDTSWVNGNSSWSYDRKSSGGTDGGSANNWGVTNSLRLSATYSNSTSTNKTKMQGPCASGYHVPTYLEFNNLKVAGGWTNGTDFSNSLKLPFAAMKSYTNGSITTSEYGNWGNYWTASPNSSNAYRVRFNTTTTITTNSSTQRANGFPVRCFKN